MSLYGGMTYPGTPFIFDKIYETTPTTEDAQKDGVLIGRYVYDKERKDVLRKTFVNTVYNYEFITNLGVADDVENYWYTF